jgi:hypothetical protein
VTTPNQPAPSYGPGYDDYAYTVGGGPWQFGSTLTEDDIAMIIHGPRGTTDNSYALFQDKLLQMPLEVLRLFQGFVPGSSMDEDFPDVPVSVSTIMQWLNAIPLNLNLDEFNQWLEDTFKPVADELQELIDAIVQGFNAWFQQIGFTPENVQKVNNDIGAAIGTLGTLGLRLEKLEKANSQVLEDFKTYPQNVASLGPRWDQWYTGSGSGSLGVVNGFAVPTLGLDTTKKFMFAAWPTAMPSDFLKVSTTISTPQELFGESENYIIGRWNPEPVAGNYIFAGFTRTRARIGYVKAGQLTQLRSVTHDFRNGSVYTFDFTEERTFRIYEGTNLVLEAVDAGAQSSFGAGFQHVGFGNFCPNGVARPGVVGSFATYLKDV